MLGTCIRQNVCVRRQAPSVVVRDSTVSQPEYPVSSVHENPACSRMAAIRVRYASLRQRGTSPVRLLTRVSVLTNVVLFDLHVIEVAQQFESGELQFCRSISLRVLVS